MSLGDRESYYLHFETNNLLKGEKAKEEILTPMTYLNYL